MKNGKKVVGFIPAPAGLYAAFTDDGGNIEVIPQNRVISLVLIEDKSDFGLSIDGFVEGNLYPISEATGFVGLVWGENQNPSLQYELNQVSPKGSILGLIESINGLSSVLESHGMAIEQAGESIAAAIREAGKGITG